MNPQIVRTDSLQLLITLFPKDLQKRLRQFSNFESLTEVVLDLGYRPVVRFGQTCYRLNELSEVTQQEIDSMVDSIGSFTSDNRAGIERTLHRISAIRNREGRIIGLTCRVGRAIMGTIEILRDIIESGQNILFLGAPGIGKTTNLRETARVLSDEVDRRVVVVDTSNEIGGDGDIPHPGIGTARRMQVPSPDQQHHVMIEAVENHTPQVIIVDEIGTEEEAAAARTIAERGVQLVATAHGYTLENLVKNPTLSDLVGGVQSVVLGDEEAKFRGTQKTVLERRSLPTFEVLIEIRDRDLFAVYDSVAHSVDALLRGEEVDPQMRQRRQVTEEKGKDSTDIDVDTDDLDATTSESDQPIQIQMAPPMVAPPADLLRIFPFGISVDQLYTAIHTLQVPVEVVMSIADADMLLTVPTQAKNKKKLSQITEGRQVPIHVLKQNSAAEVVNFLRHHFKLPETDEGVELEAVREARKACKRAQDERRMIELAPRHAYLRRVQHDIAEEEGLNSMSVGDDPNRRVRIYPKLT